VVRELDLFDGAFYDEPAEAYRWLRDEAPVYRDRTNEVWALSRHADVVWAEKNAGLLSSAVGYRPWMGTVRRVDRAKLNLLAHPRLAALRGNTRRNMMINEDDPTHQEMRTVLASMFTRRAVTALEERVRLDVRGLLDAVADRGECDVAQEVAVWLPVIVIGDLLGFAPEERPLLRRCAEHGNLQGTGPGLRYYTAETIDSMCDFHDAAMELIAARRVAPRDDLVSRLIAARFDGVPLTDNEIFAEMLLLTDGGADTTHYAITGGIVALLEHRDAVRAATRDVSLWPAIVEECLRWTTPIVNMCRTASEDIELHGTTIRRGEWVTLLYGAANHDDRVFEDPHRFRPHRFAENVGSRHVAFGFGTHYCLGAHLARLELRVVFEELFGRFPDLELSGPIGVNSTAFVRGIDRLGLSLGAQAQVA
jgi:cytochrome P450 family 142 subfamily A polypeptide 1